MIVAGAARRPVVTRVPSGPVAAASAFVAIRLLRRAADRQRVATAGVSDRVRIDLCNYREIDGCYDAVISVGTLEAVGYRLRPDYFRAHAETLRLWRERFMQHRKTLGHIGFDEVISRIWELYLAHAEAGFRSGYLNVHQWTFVSAAAP